MLTLEDLGVLRDVTVEGDTVVVTITPTYSGCPALDDDARGRAAPPCAEAGLRRRRGAHDAVAGVVDRLDQPARPATRSPSTASPRPAGAAPSRADRRCRSSRRGGPSHCPRCGSPDTS